jgi:putative hydrolase of the HAD superfamily
MITAITFDFWNTLVRATDEQGTWRLHAWTARLAEAGIVIDEETVRDAFRAEWQTHHAGWMSGTIYDGEMAGNGAVDRLAAITGASLEPLRADLVHAFLTEGENAEFVTCPGVDDVVPALAAAGIKLGIICDVGFTPSTGLRRLLTRFGLLDCFTGWSFSDEVRHYKPSRVIFEHALGYLGSTPDETAHIGDIRRTDVVGARGMGMTAIRYRAVADDTDDAHPEGHHVIDHHDQLAEVLGLDLANW